MAKKNQKKIEDSENVLADASVSAGKNVHIGNIINNHYIKKEEEEKKETQTNKQPAKKKQSWKFLETTLFKVILFSVTLIGVSISIDQCNFIEIAEMSPSDPVKNLTNTVDTPSVEPDNKGTVADLKNNSHKAKNRKKNYKPVIKLSFNNTNKDLEQKVTNAILSKAQQNGFNLFSTTDDLKFDEVFECNVQIQKEEVELGIRSSFKVSFTLTITHFKLSSRKPIATYTQKSPEYFIYDEKKILPALETWVDSIDSNSLFKKSNQQK